MRNLPDEICVIWHIDDIMSQCSDLTKNDARKILNKLQRHHDATIGITWEVIDAQIESYKDKL